MNFKTKILLEAFDLKKEVTDIENFYFPNKRWTR